MTRIVYDEIHLYMTSSFRLGLRNVLPFTSRYHCPNLDLSATIPPEMERALRLELGESAFVTIRAPSHRANLCYDPVLKGTMKEMEDHLQDFVAGKRQAYHNDEKLIIFALTKKDASYLQRLLTDNDEIGLFTGDLTTAEKDELLDP